MRFFKTLQLVALFTLLSVVAQAQYSVGVKIGGNIANANLTGISKQILPEQLNFPGVVLGVVGEIPLQNGFSFRPELEYIQKGFTIRVAKDDIIDLFGINLGLEGKNKTRLNYLEVPLLIKYSYGNDLAKVYGIVGPSVGYALNGYARQVATLLIDINIAKQDLPLEKDAFQRFELGGIVGIGGEVKAGQGKIFGDVRYDFGINSIIHNTLIDFKARNKGPVISVGYAYNF